uniref:Uncharacterized protein n=1 Tax=Globisporangium ultimum (strain ATCC 200006 / CBS 805.95 / DAOM BR144) TaxID=431595 RepID=K3X3N9_GLOUD
RVACDLLHIEVPLYSLQGVLFYRRYSDLLLSRGNGLPAFMSKSCYLLLT